jgi:TRAP-type C4-dicarboxylate transport system substrate-binding protein
MMYSRRRAIIVWGMTVISALGLLAGANSEPLFRISLENTADHVQVTAVRRFADRLAERTRGELRVELYSDARLFRDRDVVRALADGKVEMAVPGTWQLDRFEPSVGILLLPGFYGRDRGFLSRHLDGPLGDEINRRLERSTGTVVLGGWIDLGPIHLFTVNRPIRTHNDIRGLRIRYAGGIVNEMRLAALGAEPRLIPWPDFPLYLRRGDVDGVLTSFETIASASLWNDGIRYAFEDRQYFGRYVPLVSLRFWARLPENLRGIIAETWNENVEQSRDDAEQKQIAARRLLEKNGVTVIVPTEAELSVVRKRLGESQPEMIRTLRLDPEIVPLIPEP